MGSVWTAEQRSGQGQVRSGRDMLPRTPRPVAETLLGFSVI